MQHRCVLALARTLVATQDRTIARMFAALQGVVDGLCKFESVLQSQVRALPRERVNRVRRIANQCQPLPDVMLGMASHQWECAARTGDLETAEHVIRCLAEHVAQLFIARSHRPRCGRLARRPHNRNASVGKWQHTERPFFQETLPGRAAMRLFRLQMSYECRLPVGQVPRAYARGLANPGACAIGANDKVGCR